jgi:UDPglucose 6-dehydrogenase
MNLCVTGTGYVGLVTGTCLAEIGHRVVCLDNDESKIQTLNAGKMPIFEPHLEDLVRSNREKGRLSFTTDFGQANQDAEAVFICVGTPPLESGEADLSAVEKVVRETASRSSSYRLIIEKSTVPVQTGEYVYRTMQIYSRGEKGLFDVASNPEFLREGSAVYDFFHPDRIVVGVENPQAERILRELFRSTLSALHPPRPPSW